MFTWLYGPVTDYVYLTMLTLHWICLPDYMVPSLVSYPDVTVRHGLWSRSSTSRSRSPLHMETESEYRPQLPSPSTCPLIPYKTDTARPLHRIYSWADTAWTRTMPPGSTPEPPAPHRRPGSRYRPGTHWPVHMYWRQGYGRSPFLLSLYRSRRPPSMHLPSRITSYYSWK